MRMRPYVHASTQQKLSGTHLIEEDEGPDHLSSNSMAAPAAPKSRRGRARATMTMSIASQANVSPGLGSMAGCQLMFDS